MIKVIVPALVVLFASGTAATALTITNSGSKEITIGLDMGDKEVVHKIGPGKSTTFDDECEQGCGVTGPWSFSKWGRSGDKIATDGTPLVVTQ